MSRIVVAMSGGVDSSVAAALLKEQGHDVIGMMLRLWSEAGKDDSNRCCSPDSMALARRVAARLDIPFYVIDAREFFRNTIVEHFLDGYAAGQTPNPCLLCNKVVRWEFLLQHALDMDAEFMATGHYVRLRRDAAGRVELLRAVDLAKDQSYVLHLLSQEKLSHALFPVGEYSKPDIRAHAARFGLPTAARPDSQDLCFLAGEDYRTFLRRNAPRAASPGPIMNLHGETIGTHAGLAFYTIGQRKGLGISSAMPLYVLSKDVHNNALIVGPDDELGSQECSVADVHWISGSAPSSPFQGMVKTRYTARPAQAIVTILPTSRVSVHFEAPQRDLTPGQAAVFYDGDVLLGGGTITL